MSDDAGKHPVMWSNAMSHPDAPGPGPDVGAYDHGMRTLVAGAALAVFLGCAGPRPFPERAVSTAHPEPDPACRTAVADTMKLRGVERITVRVGLVRNQAAVDLLAPELTPAEAAEVRRAFAECAWRPGEGGATTGTIVFSLP